MAWLHQYRVNQWCASTSTGLRGVGAQVKFRLEGLEPQGLQKFRLQTGQVRNLAWTQVTVQGGKYVVMKWYAASMYPILKVHVPLPSGIQDGGTYVPTQP